MITLQPPLEPMIDWSLTYTPAAEVRWLHGANAVLVGEQIKPSKGTAVINPTAIFTVVESTYAWEEAQW